MMQSAGEGVNAVRVSKVFEMTVAGSRERVFPLLCPVREHEWLPGWRARTVHSESGVAEEGGVFETDNPGQGPMTWVVSQYAPSERVQYTVFKAGSHVWTLTITLAARGHDACHLTWERTFTALTDAGRQFVAEYTEEKHQAQSKRLERCLSHFLNTGEMLREA